MHAGIDMVHSYPVETITKKNVFFNIKNVSIFVVLFNFGKYMFSYTISIIEV